MTTEATSEFLLLLRGGDWDASPDQLQQTVASFSAWFEKLSAAGTIKAGQPLADDVRIVSGRDGARVFDGPFAESKEAVGGYVIVRAFSFEEAVALARECPILQLGVALEVRPIAEACPLMHLAAQTLTGESEPGMASSTTFHR